MPKSMINASPCESIMMLAGFRSRCTTPAACAATRPDTTARMVLITRGIDSLPTRLISVARSVPST
jgi:hypothetical protein